MPSYERRTQIAFRTVPFMSIGQSIFRGSVWMIVLNGAGRLIGLASTAILARLLLPADFGIVAMAMSVIGVIELFAQFGFDSALIQRQDATRHHYDTVWTLRVGFALFISICIATLAVPASQFFDDARLIPVMFCLAPLSLLSALENIGVVNFRKEMTFDKEFRFTIIRRLVSFFITVSLAVIFRSYWALVLGMLAGRLIGVTLSYVMEPFRPKFCLSEARSLFGFSGWIFVNSLIGAISSRLSQFLIGKLYGASALGLYTISFEVAELPATEFSAPINRAAFPGYSRLRLQDGGLEAGFLSVLGVVALIVIPAAVGIVVVAEPLVYTLLGKNWTGATPIIEVLAISAMLNACTSGNYYVYLAQARTKVPIITGIAHTIVFLVLLVFVYKESGVVGVAKAELGATIASTLLSLQLLLYTTNIRLLSYLTVLWRPAAGALTMFFVLGIFVRHTVAESAAIVNLFTSAAAGVVIYSATVAALWIVSGRPVGAEQNIIDKLYSWFARRR